MEATPNRVDELHKVWCMETGQTANQRIWERAYVDFLQHYTADDLRLVLQHIKSLNKKSDAKFSLRLNKFFDFEYMHFDALLSEAKATKRNRRPAPDAKTAALSELRPVVDVEQASTISLNAGHHISEFIRRPNG